jgi:SAM-dependent methyltransferase
MSGQEGPPVCDYEGSDYQQRFWGAGERAYEDRVEAIALARLLPPGGGRLLEIGAGAGRNTARYEGFEQVVLLDYSRSQLQQAQARLGGGQSYLYVVGDAYRLPFGPAVFDAATMIRTLHHMARPDRALSQAAAVLRTAAPFILEYANKRNLKAILRWALGRQPWRPFGMAPVEFAELNFNFHPAAVRGWLEAAGLREERRLAVSSLRLGILKRSVPLMWLVGLDSAWQGIGGLWPLSPSVFVRARMVLERPEGAQFWRCPACRSTDLAHGERGLRCRSCGRLWGVADGLYDFREPLEGPA